MNAGHTRTVTTSLATASTKVYTVTFDGSVISVLALRRQKVLRQIPLTELAGVEFKPSRGLAGGSLRFRVRGKASARDTIFFRGDQEPDVANLARIIERYADRAQLPPPADPWPPLEVPERRAVGDPQSNAAILRALRWAVRLEAVTLVLVLAPIVLVLAGVVWLLLA